MMRHACSTALAIGLALLGAPSPARADATTILNHLQTTPASQLDLSLARVGLAIDTAGAGAGFGGFADVENNKIMIRAYAPTAQPDQASCKKIMDRIKTAGGVDPKTGHPDDPASAFAAQFSYPNIDESKIDPSYAETVDSMITIMVVIGQTGNGQGMVCQSRLVSPDVTYQKQ